MKTILHLTETSEVGGSEAILAYLAKNLDLARYHSMAGLLEDGWLRGELERLNVSYLFIENKRSFDPIFILNLVRIIRKYNVNLIHAHEFVTTFYGAAAARLAGIPAIGNIHGKGYFTEKTRRRLAYKIAIGMCSQVVAVSSDLKEYLIRELNLSDRDKILVIPNGIDVCKYTPQKANVELRRIFGIPDNAILAGSVGALTRVKGLINLIRAAEKVACVIPEFRLILIGEGDQDAHLRQEIASKGLENIITMSGFRDDVPELLNLLDIYICSSLSEGLSLSIMEAMSTGKPVVATNVGGNPELITPGENGLLVAPEDPSSMANSIIDLINNKKYRETLGKKGREIVENKYSLEKMIKNYDELYQNILGRY